MTELSQIAEAADNARKNSQPSLLATVVRVTGSSYRQPGARMLLTDDGWQAGCISGGCLESDIIRKAWWRTEGGQAVVVTYDSTTEDEGASYDDPLSWGLGLGCNGIVEVLLERLSPDDPTCPAAFIGECLRRRHTGIIATIIASDKRESIGQRMLWHADEASPAACTITDSILVPMVAETVRNSLLSAQATQTLRKGEVDLLLEAIQPPTPLLICGANHDAAPLARLAKTVGWQVTVVDPWVGSPPRPERFPGADTVLCCAPADITSHLKLEPGSFAVVMSHNLAHDAGFLGALLRSPVRYIGLLGPRQRAERLLASLKERGIHFQPDDPRIFGPIGLDIGAEDPETIALAVLAEMQAVKSERSGGFLRERPCAIHDSVRTSPVRRHSRRHPASSKAIDAI